MLNAINHCAFFFAAADLSQWMCKLLDLPVFAGAKWFKHWLRSCRESTLVPRRNRCCGPRMKPFCFSQFWLKHVFLCWVRSILLCESTIQNFCDAHMFKEEWWEHNEFHGTPTPQWKPTGFRSRCALHASSSPKTLCLTLLACSSCSPLLWGPHRCSVSPGGPVVALNNNRDESAAIPTCAPS